MIQLKPDEKAWMAAKWKNIRESQQLADKASKKWKQVNDSVNDYMNRSGITDIVQRAKIKGESLALKDALSTHKWHAEEAQRHIDDVHLFLKMKELEVF